MPGGVGLDHLAAVLPDRDRPAGAAPDHADEADHPLRLGRGGRVERGAAGEGGRGEGAAHATGSGSTPPWCRRTWPIRPTPGCWPRRSAGSPPPAGGSRPPVARSAPSCGTGPGPPGGGRIDLNAKLRTRSAAATDEALAAVRRKNGELADLAETAAARRRTAAGQRQTGAAASPGEGRRAASRRRPRRGGRAASWPAGPRGQRPDRAAGRDPPDRRADPAAAGRDHPGRGDPAGQPARPRRPADRQGPARQAGRVRPQGPGLSTTTTASSSTTTSQPGNPADAPRLEPAVERVEQPHRPHTPHRHRRPRLRRSQASTTPCTTSASATS